jgi:multidrug efflux pump subunit AcrA (membrane-fusion protein)
MGMSKIKKTIILISLFIIILITIFLYKKNHNGEWVQIKEAKIVDAIYGLATLESDEIFRYRVGITTQIKKIYVKEGINVKKGDLLLELFEGHSLRSPISGVVTQLEAKANETVFPNTNLITIMNLQKVALTITLDQDSAIRVRSGLSVKAQFESLKSTPLIGTVRSIYPKDGQYVVKVDLKELPPSILPGMTADTAIIIGEKEKALVVPIRSVQHGGWLTIRENGKRKKIQVKVGLQDSENIELIESNTVKLMPGMEVWVSKK